MARKRTLRSILKCACAVRATAHPTNAASHTPIKSLSTALPHPLTNTLPIEPLEPRRLLTFTINGTNGIDTIEMRVEAGVISVTLNGVTSTRSDSAESAVIINAFDGYDTIKLHSTGDNAVSVYGGAGEDEITFGEASGLISSIGSPVYVDGGDGTDFVRFYDWANTTTGNLHTLNPTTYDTNSSAPVTYASISAMHIYGGEQADSFQIDGTPLNLETYIRPNRGADSISVNRTAAGAFVSIDSSNNTSGEDSLTISNGTGTALVHQKAPLSLGALGISTGGQLKLRAGGATTVTARSVQVLGNGSIDLTDNALVVDYGTSPSPLAILRSLVTTGYNGGSWTGNGVRSSNAAAAPLTQGVGVFDSASISGAYPRLFAGTQVTRPAVLLRQVMYGDTDLDGKVGLSDFNRLARNFASSGKQWLDGDFDFDGTVSLPDFNRLAANFGSAGTKPALPIPIGLNVTTFGAVPDDGIDDTAAIRAAIDALHEGDGSPAGSGVVGGVIYFPAGTFDINSTIRIKSGVKFLGAGATLTTIHDTWNESTHAALELYSPFDHQWNVGAGLEDLTIYSDRGRGVSIDPNMGGHLVDFRMHNVRVSAQGVGIDLRQQFVVHTDLDNVEVFNPGSTAIYTGRYDGTGFSMRLRNFQVTGVARSGFVAEQGLVLLTSDVNVYGMTISTSGAPVVPLYLTDSITLTDVDIRPSVTPPDGVAVLIEDCTRVLINSITNIGVSRRLRLINAHDVQIRNLMTDGSSSAYSLLTLVDAQSYLRVANNLNGTIQPLAAPPPPTGYVPAPMPTRILDVRDFGAVPDDGLDDSTAIQAAIDSIPLGEGLGAFSSDVGGVVQFPAGVMHTSVPIRIPSGVWLRGQENASIIRNLMPVTFTGRAAIEFYSPFTHGYNVGAGLEGLGITTIGANATIKSDSSITSELKDLHIAGVRLSPGGVGVDFRNVTLSHLDVDRIVITDPSTTAFWFGKSDNSSHDNVVRGIRVTGAAPPNFVSEQRGFWTFYGGYTIEGGALEDVFPDTPVLPFYGSGSFKISGMYMEFPAQAGGVSFQFENCSMVDIDRLYHIDAQRRLQFNNVANAYVSNLGIDGTTVYLRDCLIVDSTSRVTLDAVNGQWDAGMLDDARVTVNGFFNERAYNFVERRVALGSPNLVNDPNFLNVGDELWGVASWQITWGTGFQGRLGTFAVETVGGVPRLRIDVPNTVNVGIKIRLNIAGGNIGRSGIARWRIDGPTQAFVWNKDYSWQYPVRVMNSLTAARTGAPLQALDEINVSLPNARGTYYLSQFGVVAT